jgi:hypothetical protein
MVATRVLLLDQVPPPTPSESVDEVRSQKLVIPVISGGNGFMETVAVVRQLEGKV